MVVKRKRLEKAIKIIEAFDADVFYSIEDVKYASDQSDEDRWGLPISRSAFDRLLGVRKGV